MIHLIHFQMFENRERFSEKQHIVHQNSICRSINTFAKSLGVPLNFNEPTTVAHTYFYYTAPRGVCQARGHSTAFSSPSPKKQACPKASLQKHIVLLYFFNHFANFGMGIIANDVGFAHFNIRDV